MNATCGNRMLLMNASYSVACPDLGFVSLRLPTDHLTRIFSAWPLRECPPPCEGSISPYIGKFGVSPERV